MRQKVILSSELERNSPPSLSYCRRRIERFATGCAFGILMYRQKAKQGLCALLPLVGRVPLLCSRVFVALVWLTGTWGLGHLWWPMLLFPATVWDRFQSY